MPRRTVFQNNFEAGELAPEFMLRADAEQTVAACKRLRNMAVPIAGGAHRRPGTVRQIDFSVPGRTFVVDVDVNTRRYFNFATDRVRIYTTDGDIEGTITGAPWPGGDKLDLINIAVFDGKVYVFGEVFMPRIIERNGASWVMSTLSFAAGTGNARRYPFYKYRDTVGIALTPSARSGNITITASAPFFSFDYVGERLRLLGRQVRITGYNSPVSVNAGVQQTIYPTVLLGVTTAAGFDVGDVIRGDLSGVEAEVIAKNSTTNVLTIQQINSQSPMIAGAEPERVVGPHGYADVTSWLVTTSGAILDWDEPLFSEARGYPAVGAFHRGRLIVSGVPALPSVIAASAVNAPDDFEVGTGATDAFIEPIGDGYAASVRHLISSENLIILTDQGSYYVPESDIGFRPDTIAFNNIGPEGATTATPALATEGVIFVNASTGRLMAVTPTGYQTRPYDVTDLSEYSYHLLNDIRRVIIANGIDGRPERYLMALNGDGTIAVMNFRRGGQVVGYSLWSLTGGTFEDAIALGGRAYAVTLRNGVSKFVEFKQDALLDESEPYAAALSGRDGEVLTVEYGGAWLGSGAVSSGLVGSIAPGASKNAGHDFVTELQPFPPVDPRTGAQPKRIIGGDVSIYQSGGFKIDGEFQSAYKGGDDLTQPPPLRTEEVEFFCFDTEDLTYAPTISQDKCAPLFVRAITMRGRM